MRWLLLSLVLLVSCTDNNSAHQLDYNNPGSFTPSDTRIKVRGCEELKARVAEWNGANPTDKKIADC